MLKALEKDGKLPVSQDGFQRPWNTRVKSYGTLHHETAVESIYKKAATWLLIQHLKKQVNWIIWVVTAE